MLVCYVGGGCVVWVCVVGGCVVGGCDGYVVCVGLCCGYGLL